MSDPDSECPADSLVTTDSPRWAKPQIRPTRRAPERNYAPHQKRNCHIYIHILGHLYVYTSPNSHRLYKRQWKDIVHHPGSMPIGAGCIPSPWSRSWIDHSDGHRSRMGNQEQISSCVTDPPELDLLDFISNVIEISYGVKHLSCDCIWISSNFLCLSYDLIWI